MFMVLSFDTSAECPAEILLGTDIEYLLVVCVDALCPTQKNFSHV